MRTVSSAEFRSSEDDMKKAGTKSSLLRISILEENKRTESLTWKQAGQLDWSDWTSSIRMEEKEAKNGIADAWRRTEK